MIKAKIIEDSISYSGVRLTTMEVTFHRFILAELNTHRDFSRNSASSRARSLSKTIQEVSNNPALPIRWPEEQRGMSGGADLSDSLTRSASDVWLNHVYQAVDVAQKLGKLGVHKSVTNRILEPFMWHTAVITATSWDNFFAQRLASLDDGVTPAAQPEMYELAKQMHLALQTSIPRQRDIGEWHLPYITTTDIDNVFAETTPMSWTRLCEISVARCAGVSYLTQGILGRDHSKDLTLYNRLRNANPPHWSPFEHVASPSRETNRCYNLTGWSSLRYLLEQEILRVEG